MLRLGISIGLALMIVACTSVEERVQRSCQRLGFTPSTPEMQQCVLQQMAAHDANRNNPVWGQMMQSGTQMMQGTPRATCQTSRTVPGSYMTTCN